MKEISLSKLTSGADLTRPQLTVGWGIAAVGGVVALLAAVAIGKYAYDMIATKAAPIVGVVPGAITELID